MSALAAPSSPFHGLWNGAYHKETLGRLKAVRQWQLAPGAAAEKAHRQILERINAIPDEKRRQLELRQVVKPDTLAQVLGFYMTCVTLKMVPGRKRWGAPILNVELSVREMATLIAPGASNISWCLKWLRTGTVLAKDKTVLGEGLGWLRSKERKGVAVINGQKKPVTRTSVRSLTAAGFCELGLASRFKAQFAELIVKAKELGERFTASQAQLDELTQTREDREAAEFKARELAQRARPQSRIFWDTADRIVAAIKAADSDSS